MMSVGNLSLSDLTAVPTDGMANKLHKAYQIQFINSLSTLISYAENVLNTNYRVIKSKLNFIESGLKHFISPALYSTFFKLRDAMENDDVILPHSY